MIRPHARADRARHPPKHVQFAILQALDLPLQLHHSATEMTVSF